MKILTGKKWKDGYLDYYRNEKGYRIKVLAFKNLEKLKDIYHIRQKSLRLLVNYFPVVGPGGLLTKVWSRIREDLRNDKYVSCGIGEIVECPKNSQYLQGTMVAFIAPWHPALAERIVLPVELIFKLEKSSRIPVQENYLLYIRNQSFRVKNKWWEKIAGWSAYSGEKISQSSQNQLKNEVTREIVSTNWKISTKIVNQNSGDISIIKTQQKSQSLGTIKAVLYGYGNYAKTNIIPYSKPYIDIQAIHEIDPTQIVLEKKVHKWLSSPFPGEGERYNVYFVASYNHTHIPITLYGLNMGAYVVVEKPIVMDREELDNLEKVLKKMGSRLFVGFHKRYSEFNQFAVKDLGVKYGEPISYHSIVYELIQPKLFWYNWPVSKSTFFANGCHQIDHFLFLNNFSKPVNYDIKLFCDNSVLVWIELENGATFSTIFSEKGSLRVGPRDIVELKVDGKNIRIIDGIKYQAEDNNKVLRRKRIFKTDSYRDMYQSIGKKIAGNKAGDSIESILVSANIMLDLEEKLQQLQGQDEYKNAKNEFLNNFL